MCPPPSLPAVTMQLAIEKPRTRQGRRPYIPRNTNPQQIIVFLPQEKIEKFIKKKKKILNCTIKTSKILLIYFH